MIVIPLHDPSRSGSGSEKSANVLCSPFVGRCGTDPCASLDSPLWRLLWTLRALRLRVLFAKAGRAPRVLLVLIGGSEG